MKLFLSIFFLITLTNNPITRIHSPHRLLLLDPSKTVSGIVREVDETIDGDVHIRLLTKETNLLTKNNLIHEDSCLVLEIVCGCKSVFAICNGYVSEITIPSVGDSISVKGLFVFDKRHKINEIHPVLKIKKL